MIGDTGTMVIHRLTLFRRQWQINIKALARISGVAESTIVRIEQEPGHHVNYTTAEAIATALKLEVYELFDPALITDIGRHAKTGTPTDRSTHVKYSGRFCLSCFLELPIRDDNECPNCGMKVSVEDRLTKEDETPTTDQHHPSH